MAKIRILMVEDNPGDVGLVKEAFEKPPYSEFYDIEAVETLAQFRQAISKERDVILLDLSLPDSVDPDTTFNEVHSHNIPVIILTGRTNGQDAIQRFYHAGLVDYVLKAELFPMGRDGVLVDRPRLTRAIRQAVDRERLHKIQLDLEAVRKQHNEEFAKLRHWEQEREKIGERMERAGLKAR